jgi:hypothetical protein
MGEGQGTYGVTAVLHGRLGGIVDGDGSGLVLVLAVCVDICLFHGIDAPTGIVGVNLHVVVAIIVDVEGVGGWRWGGRAGGGVVEHGEESERKG